MFFLWRRRKADQASQRFNGYQIVKLIHEGRKSIVYQARYGSGEPDCVVKSYNPRYDQEARRMLHKHQLRAEGQIGKVLNAPESVDPAKHPIVHTVDFGNEFGKSDRPYYVVLEYVRGYNLKNLVTTQPVEVRGHARALLEQIINALAFIHDRQLLHRDFCTDNVMVANGWQAKIIDFGFACPPGRSFEQRSGTPTYMAPEQFSAQPLTPASDIYSMGVVAYELFTGRTPFVSVYPINDPELVEKRMMQLMEQHLHQPPPSPREFAPDLSKEMEAFLLRCLAKKPEQRFAGMLQVRRALQRVPVEP